MKILDRYILKTYLKTFLSVFTILMFIFVLQTIWLYISELAGKDLDIAVVGKFLLYFAPKMVPLVLPLTILLASIMVFGNFAENYEFAAMKSTGISLQRAMRSLAIFIFALAIGAFFFANNVIPWAEYESYNLRRNIAKVKPAMAIAEGQFNDIGNINIKVENKTGDRGQYLDNVIIHKKKNSRPGNYTVIVADKGELISSEDSNILQLELTDGNYYDELITKNNRDYVARKPHAQSAFEKYIINVDLANLNNVDLDDKSSDGRYNMLNISELNYTIDSLYQRRKDDFNTLSNTLYNRSTYETLSVNIEPKTDTIFNGEVLDLFNNQAKIQVLNLAMNTATSTTQILETNKKTYAERDAWRNRHIIALHDKYVLALACIILFFVGAPLGALIKKGGLGLPMVIAIVLFLSYHFIGIFSKNSAKDGTFSPVVATWLSTAIMLPLSIYLTSRATKDRGLFEMDVILVPLKKLFNFKSKNGSEDVKRIQSYSYYNKHSIEELVAVVKDQNEFQIDKKPKQIAIQHLMDRGLSLSDMREKGLDVPTNLQTAKVDLKDYIDYSTTSLVTYSIGAVLLILHFVFRNNKLPELAITVRDLSIISFVIFLIYVIVSFIFYRKFYASLSGKRKMKNPLVVLLTLPLYPFEYFLYKSKMKHDFHLNTLEKIN
ncbi:LptF/LptG family permease [Winogradskyella maritima]|uniref:LptF/LptG family permease n=1 Tax=Winogradskyella maritima TaxID=1517766 RepID=A0ABV8AC20_9FLAO